MELLDATLSLAVAFCLLGGLFWPVRSPHPTLAAAARVRPVRCEAVVPLIS